MSERIEEGASSVPSDAEPTTHELKVWPAFFAALLDGAKTFEFRKDDRTPRYTVGDVLLLREWGQWTGYTGRECLRRVTYVARGEIIPDGYCIMSVEQLRDGTKSGVLPVAPSPADLSLAGQQGEGRTEEYRPGPLRMAFVRGWRVGIKGLVAGELMTQDDAMVRAKLAYPDTADSATRLVQSAAASEASKAKSPNSDSGAASSGERVTDEDCERLGRIERHLISEGYADYDEYLSDCAFLRVLAGKGDADDPSIARRTRSEDAS